jgi:hypothetical protein
MPRKTGILAWQALHGAVQSSSKSLSPYSRSDSGSDSFTSSGISSSVSYAQDLNRACNRELTEPATSEGMSGSCVSVSFC